MTIRALALLAILGGAALAASGHAAAQAVDEPLLRVRVDVADVAATKLRLVAQGYDVLEVDAAEGAIELAMTSAERRRLEAEGYATILIGRGQPLLQALQSGSPASSGLGASAAAVPAIYKDLGAILVRMQEIADAYPAIVRLVDITATYGTPPTAEGRHLYALKISDNPAADEDEPAMLIVSAHHAREISTPVITLGAAERLTAGYGTDARITAAVNGHEIWVAPVWNPDGYSHVFTTDNLWRKNRRVFPAGVGVDQNRNYSQGWSAPCAGSTSVSSETYKGPSAASEAETQTLMIWSERERFAKIIDYHSYGREVLYAYLCLSHPFTSWMQQEAAALSVASGYDGATRLPSAEGEHPQWQFAKMGAYAFLIETHTQFQPSHASAVTEATRVWPGVLAVLDRSIPVAGHVTDARTGAPLSAAITLQGVGFTNGESQSSGGPYGAYHLFVPAGTYDVSFTVPGYVPSVKRVTVTQTSASTVDVQMSPDPTEPSTPQHLRIVR